MAAGFFPLDEELQLPSSGLTPHAHEALALLGTLSPFARAAKHLETLLKVQVSTSTTRRLTEQAGACLEHWQDQQAQPLAAVEVEDPLPARLAMATDGVLVSVRPHEWTEVKMVTVGTISKRTTPAKDEQEEEAVICCEDLSYFARLADAQTFGDLASGEIRRRGVERVGAVAALQDGAEWIPAFVQGQRADAICILDFAHAAGYVSEIGQLAQRAGIDLPPTWFAEQAHALKQQGPAGVLTEVQRLRELVRSEEISEKVAYLCKREAQMQYPQYQADGWPIGSGMAESGNKLVVQARLKGAGMHWDRARVNAMLALRTTLASSRWSQDWPVVRAAWHTQRLTRLRTRQQAALAKATRQLQDAFWRLPLSVVLACVPAPPPPPPTSKGRTEGQRRWGRQTFSLRAIRAGRYAKI